LEFQVLVLDRLKNMAGSNLLIESQPSSFGNWTFNANTDNNKLHIIAILFRFHNPWVNW
jgi:hypothetical protein